MANSKLFLTDNNYQSAQSYSNNYQFISFFIGWRLVIIVSSASEMRFILNYSQAHQATQVIELTLIYCFNLFLIYFLRIHPRKWDFYSGQETKIPLQIWWFARGDLYSLVPRAGVEPARLSASVFETDLSTDSNIWAESGCKGNSFFRFLQINLQKFCG